MSSGSARSPPPSSRCCPWAGTPYSGSTAGRARPFDCSTELVGAGAQAVLVAGGVATDRETGRRLVQPPPDGFDWAIAGDVAVTARTSPALLALTDLGSGSSFTVPDPSRIGGRGGPDSAAVHPNGRLLALSFADPAHLGSGTQVMDTWLLQLASRRLAHLPDMPSVVELKRTSMAWTSDGPPRLAGAHRPAARNVPRSSRRETVVAVWKPGQRRIAVRAVRIPDRTSGSDAFVAW